MIIKKIVIWTIRGYQKMISRYTPPTCRFYPSCSKYTVEAIVEYGLIRGSLMGSWRILRCNPFSAGGFEPVPKRGNSHE